MDPSAAHDADAASAQGRASSAASSPSSSSSPAVKRRRSATVSLECCRTCRLRKVKCTGNPRNGACTNCARLELACSFVNADSPGESSDRVSRTTPNAVHTEAGTLRKRAQRACGQCHSHKTKCSGDLPRCKRCEASNLVCEYTPTKRKFTNVRFNATTGAEGQEAAAGTPDESSASPATASMQGYQAMLADPATLTAEDTMIKRDLILRHMDIYMEYLYGIPSLGFLHPPTFYRQIQDMTIHPAKAAAICSVACFFANPGEVGREFGQRCCNQVEMYLLRGIDRFSEETLLLTTLNTFFNLENGSYARVWSCLGIGSRIMTGLQANWGASSTEGKRSFIEEESLRRLVWQTFYMDRLLAGGYEEYIITRAENMRIRLPCTEDAYRNNKPVITDRLQDNPPRHLNSIGLHGWHIRLTDLRHRVQVAVKKLTLPAADLALFEPSSVMMEINSLQSELSRFHLSLPPEYRFTEQNIAKYMASSEDRVSYGYLHSHLGASHVDLYRFSLPGVKDTADEILRRLPRDFVLLSQKQAVGHAICLAEYFEAIRAEYAKHPSTLSIRLTGDYSLPHMCTQAIRVLLVAIRHRLYEDLAGKTTVPPWRGLNTCVFIEDDLRRMVNNLVNVMEPWQHIFSITKNAYDCNRAMVGEFFQTGQINERGNGTVLEASNQEMAMPTTEPSLLLAGNDTSVANQWSAGLAYGASTTGNAGYDNGEFGLEPEQTVAMPGIPLFLEQALMSSTNDEAIPFYDGDNAFVATQGNMWPTPHVNGGGAGGDFGAGMGYGKAATVQQIHANMMAQGQQAKNNMYMGQQQQQQQYQHGTMNGLASQRGNGCMNSGPQHDGQGGGY